MNPQSALLEIVASEALAPLTSELPAHSAPLAQVLESPSCRYDLRLVYTPDGRYIWKD